MVYSWIQETGVAVSVGEQSLGQKYLGVGEKAMVVVFCTHHQHSHSVP